MRLAGSWSRILIVAAAACSSNAAITRTYSITMQGQPAGELTVRVAGDGTRTSTSTIRVRGAVETTRSEVVLDPVLGPRRFRATGQDHFGQPFDERLTADATSVRWQSTTDRGSAPVRGGWYLPTTPSDDVIAGLARTLLRAPHRVKLLPSGEAWLEDHTTRELTIDGARRTVHRLAIAGLGFEPVLVWIDDAGELFASVSPWDSLITRGHEALAKQLLAEDQAWTTARSARLAAKLAHRPPAAGLAITHARVFDSERRKIVDDATVIVVGDRITAVGDSSIPVPAGAQVIDAHGRTLIPGLWDMHVHLQETEGALHLASGVTTVRDLGNDLDDVTARAARYDDGRELGPHVLRAGLIDSPSPYTAGIGLVASTPAEAAAAVARYADAGFVQIKIYNSVAPSLVPVIVAAAHRRGLRVSGHVPNTMNAAQAVEAGFDELQHINFLFLRFLAGPEDDTRTQLRVTRVAERAAGLDLHGADVQQFFELLLAHRTVIDPTLTVFHKMFTSDPGEIDPVYAAYEARLPAQIARGARSGGLAATTDQRARYRASYAALLQFVKLAWDRKVPIATGTDYFAGVSLPHELELYVQAGIPAADVLAMATLGDAHIMGRDRDSGSITSGKLADLVLIDGDPTRDIAEVRNTDAVICRGVVYEPAELYAAVGMRPR